MVLLAMMTSMRIGEILGLRWGRIDLRNGIIRVVESCYRGTFSTVKTRKSERQIPMSPILLVALRKWRELRPGVPDNLVFATRRNKPLSDGTLLKRYVYLACDRLKIPRVSWHMFRHLHGRDCWRDVSGHWPAAGVARTPTNVNATTIRIE